MGAYLEKENRQAELLDNNYTPEYWFNNESEDVQAYDVRRAIDNNIAKLSKGNAKFFLINISHSEKELRFLKETFQYANTMQHGDYEQKQELKEFLKTEGDLKKQSGQYSELDNLPAVSIANDIDDDAVYGKYRQRKKLTRTTNSR